MLLSIVNNYVAAGDFSADEKFAPLGCWFKALAPNLAVAVALTACTLYQSCIYSACLKCIFVKDTFIAMPGSIATSVLPNVLGFGIGVYALIFSMSDKFVKMFHARAQEANKRGEKISVLTLNADMAYPLLIIALAIVFGLLQQIFKESSIVVGICWLLLWYSLVETIGLIGVIFRIGEQALLDKVESGDESS